MHEAGITIPARPCLAPKARLRWDRLSERYMLLYPERGLLLSRTAAEVLELCTGASSVADIVDRLAVTYAEQPRALIERQVTAFLEMLAARGLLEDRAEEAA